MESVGRLGDGELLAGLKRLVGAGKAWLVRLLEHMGEVDARGLYRERAFPSMFEYAIRELGMSEDEAYVRIRVARLAREFPLVLEVLGKGELHLTGIKVLAPVLTQANHAELLRRARGMTKREVEVLLAELAPKPDVTGTIRRLPETKAQVAITSAVELVLERVVETKAAAESCKLAEAQEPVRMELQLTPPARKEPSALAPLSPGRFKVQFTAHQRLHDKLEEARDLMRHQVPDGDLAELVERAMDLLIAAKKKSRFGTGVKRRSRRKVVQRAGSRHIANHVKREVVERDEGQCSFVSKDGRRCGDRGWVQFHHQLAYALGGGGDAENIGLLCQAHNALLAERDFGREFVLRRRRSVGPERVESEQS